MFKQIQIGKKDKNWATVLLVVLAFLSLLYFLAYNLSKWMAVPLETLTRDTFAMAGVPVYTGIISNIGVLLWYFTSAICLFTAYAGRRKVPLRGMFLYIGVFTFVLATDDFLMLHEYVFPLELGISEKILYAVYALAAVVFLVRYIQEIINSRIWILVAAFGFFALSMGIDSIELFQQERYWRIVVFENYFKLLGVGSWMIYFAARAKEYLVTAYATPPSE